MMPEFSTDNTQRDALRERLAQAGGHESWRSLEEFAQTEAFQATMHNEFPAQASTPINDVTRRNFMRVMGASLAFAGLGSAGCSRQPREMIVPYVIPPEEMIPGKPVYFASAFNQGGYAKGVLVESHMGRPTKIEGLPGHPSSLGATDAQTQASILDLYDPDRSQVVRHLGNVGVWDDFVAAAKGVFDDTASKGGEGVRILTETVTSPTLTAQLRALLKRYPNAKWHQYDPSGRESAREGARLAFGEYVDTIYHFDKAEVVVSLDSDFLSNGPANVRYARDYAHARAVEGSGHGDESHGETHLNRLYAFESSPTNTGASADHRYPVRPSQIETIAAALNGGSLGDVPLAREIEAVRKDLQAHRGKSIVIAGDHQPASVHALAHALNDALGNAGETVEYIAPVEAEPVNQIESLRELSADMAAGDVELLLILGGNPVYTAPVDFDFANALGNVPLRAHLGLYSDETSHICQWHIPALHYLEAWGDVRAYDGTVSLVQPLIAPLYAGKSTTEVLSALLDETAQSSHNVLQNYWKQERGETDFARFWAGSLSQGTIEGTAFEAKSPRLQSNISSGGVASSASGFEVVFLPDPSVGDGTYSNNAWLQEVPNPLTKLCWDNAVIMGVSTAARLGLQSEDRVRVTYDGRTIEENTAVWIQPGHALDTITLHLGYGRSRSGRVANGMGFNAYSLRTSSAQGIAVGAEVTKISGTYPLARTEEHFNIVNRDGMKESKDRGLVRVFTSHDYDADPNIVHAVAHDPKEHETLLDLEEKRWDNDDVGDTKLPRNKWAMTIDLNVCTGCNACIVACQSENLIPVVGKEEVRIGREMHWLRVDRHYQGDDLDNPATRYQPLPCMQCENAPCEVVCPVGATQHSKEGLNDMVYNRCIGTRYCSNNCPYKVRRFNFYNYTRTPQGPNGAVNPESLKPMRNPDVTLRTRGVMEKCTYCVQRINVARIEAKKEGRGVRDGEVVSACQQVCPSAAITFGNLNDPESKVTQLTKSHRNYSILSDLNTRARTTYLAKLTNPNPESTA